eukprot:3292076-Amphidinium_carterae.1
MNAIEIANSVPQGVAELERLCDRAVHPNSGTTLDAFPAHGATTCHFPMVVLPLVGSCWETSECVQLRQ